MLAASSVTYMSICIGVPHRVPHRVPLTCTSHFYIISFLLRSLIIPTITLSSDSLSPTCVATQNPMISNPLVPGPISICITLSLASVTSSDLVCAFFQLHNILPRPAVPTIHQFWYERPWFATYERPWYPVFGRPCYFPYQSLFSTSIVRYSIV